MRKEYRVALITRVFQPLVAAGFSATPPTTSARVSTVSLRLHPRLSLMTAGFDVHLANTATIKQYEKGVCSHFAANAPQQIKSERPYSCTISSLLGWTGSARVSPVRVRM
jgi:hypothetical protein